MSTEPQPDGTHGVAAAGGSTRLVLTLQELSRDDLGVAGGKGANLGEPVRAGYGGTISANLSLGIAPCSTATVTVIYARHGSRFRCATRSPVAIMLFEQLAARAANLLNFATVPSPGLIDPTVLRTFALWTGYAIALFGFHIFEPLPARPSSSRRTQVLWCSTPAGT